MGYDPDYNSKERGRLGIQRDATFVSKKPEADPDAQRAIKAAKSGMIKRNLNADTIVPGKVTGGDEEGLTGTSGLQWRGNTSENSIVRAAAKSYKQARAKQRNNPG